MRRKGLQSKASILLKNFKATKCKYVRRSSDSTKVDELKEDLKLIKREVEKLNQTLHSLVDPPAMSRSFSQRSFKKQESVIKEDPRTP